MVKQLCNDISTNVLLGIVNVRKQSVKNDKYGLGARNESLKRVIVFAGVNALCFQKTDYKITK